MTSKVTATVTLGPKKLLGKGARYADVYIVKPRSVLSERARSYDVMDAPDGRLLLTFEYVSGGSVGASNRGTISGRVYLRHKKEAVDEVVVMDEHGAVIERREGRLRA